MGTSLLDWGLVAVAWALGVAQYPAACRSLGSGVGRKPALQGLLGCGFEILARGVRQRTTSCRPLTVGLGVKQSNLHPEFFF